MILFFTQFNPHQLGSTRSKPYIDYQTASHSAKAVLSKLRPSVGGGSSRSVQPSGQSGSRCASVGSWQAVKPKASQQGRKTMSRQARKEHLDCRCAAA